MTTGRINQVAILSDVAHRSGPGSTGPARARPSFGTNQSRFEDLQGRSPRVRSMHRVREHSTSSWPAPPSTAGQEHGDSLVVLRSPSRGNGWRGTCQAIEFHSIGRQHRNHPYRATSNGSPAAREPAGSLVDRSVREHGAGQQGRSNNHSHARTFAQTSTTRRTTPRARKGHASKWRHRATPLQHRWACNSRKGSGHAPGPWR